ncbi:ORF MSV084 hypothetical protein [Melanoplus sanguinipes entomopoxvirus]|uniref:Uncharacterized protein n=1 Tax=Melanoplus sanguinipes entomopoxvirus TaxID=83191 RepID=Q9YW08_MSEPV|nr:ORF MSV084 hypothetical protein [Melanoplus sanguinipes entomopoxvirus]AAC97637.1 ORF MSV084 hypothetical protein [Melanoplus sanguinipes entomopoxvirus 'O']
MYEQVKEFIKLNNITLSESYLNQLNVDINKIYYVIISCEEIKDKSLYDENTLIIYNDDSISEYIINKLFEIIIQYDHIKILGNCTNINLTDKKKLKCYYIKKDKNKKLDDFIKLYKAILILKN